MIQIFNKNSDVFCLKCIHCPPAEFFFFARGGRFSYDLQLMLTTKKIFKLIMFYFETKLLDYKKILAKWKTVHA